jgi:hypothetical protein
VDANITLELVEMILEAEGATEQPRALDAHHVQTLLKRLQLAPSADEGRVARLEWKLLPLLGRHTVLPVALQKALGRDPAFFIDVLKAVFRRRSDRDRDDEGTRATPASEEQRVRAQRGWRLLHDWQKFLPGSQPDGSIDLEALRTWVTEARSLAQAEDRLEVCDLTLGEALAHSPGEEDGTWPCIPVRELFEEVDSRDLETGLTIGIMNKRGVFTKSLREGGTQENQLADYYENQAKASQNRWFRIAAVLSHVARDYRSQAKEADAASAEDAG